MPVLKAVMIIIIVLGHLVYYAKSPVFGFFHELSTSAVAMFFFASGFGLVRSWQRKGLTYLRGFFKSRILRILLPAFLFLLIHFLLCGTGSKTLAEMLRQFWRNGITTPPQFWFLFALLFDYLLFWVCFRFVSPQWRLPVLLTGCILYIAATLLAGYDRCWWVCALAFPTGCWFAEKEGVIARHCSRTPVHFMLGLLAGAGLFLAAYLPGKPFLWPLCYVAIPWILALIVCAVPMDRLNLPVVGFMGAVSYEIYLSHITVLDFLQRFHGLTAHPWVYILVAFLSIGVLSYGIHRFCSYILSR